jgi:TM2 domain-containing membrane protein YozV
MTDPTPKFYKDPAIAVVLSFLVCGLGQIYNGQYAKGFVLIVCYAVAWWLTIILIGFLIAPILWISGMVDAYQSAKRINERLAGGEAV